MKRIFIALLMSCASLTPAQNLSNTTPAAQLGYQNILWQYDNSTPVNISAEVPIYNPQGSPVPACVGMQVGSSPLGTAATPGFISFGSMSNYWHEDITNSPVDPNDAYIKNFINQTSSNNNTSTLTITNSQVASNVLTLMGYTGTAQMSVGRTIILAGLTAGSALNGTSWKVASIVGGIFAPTGITATPVTGTYTNYGPVADTGTATTTDMISYIHPDFGSSFGIPFSVVDSSVTPLVNVEVGGENTGLYATPSQSDDPAMPIPTYNPIESLPPYCYNPNSPYTDGHSLVLDKNTCWLYEMYQTESCNGQWAAASTAIWDMTDPNPVRPVTWTSVDAAGLSVLSGLVRYDEVLLGQMNHATRVTFVNTNHSFVFPASHWAATDNAFQPPSPIPNGMRLRLKASYDISGFSNTMQVILRAWKQYGLITADNGSNMFTTGTIDGRWNDSDVHNLTLLTINDFDIVQMPAWYTVLSQDESVCFAGLTTATWLNGTCVITTYSGSGAGNDWSGFTAATDHADVPYATDTGTVTLSTLPTGSGTLMNGPLVMPMVGLSVSGGVLNVTIAPNSGSNIPTGANPVINSLTATASTGAGAPVTLSWSVSNDTYEYFTVSPTANPQVGAVRDSTPTAIVTPTVTTTYTLNAQNLYGQTTASVTVTVP